MPIWLRRFTFRSIQDDIDRENEQVESSKGKKKLGNTKTVKPPSFVTKARKK